MKTKMLSILLTTIATTFSYGGTPITEAELPKPVTDTLAEYFPGSKILAAEKDNDEGKAEYEIRIQYKKIKIDVDVSPEGKIINLDKEH